MKSVLIQKLGGWLASGLKRGEEKRVEEADKN